VRWYTGVAPDVKGRGTLRNQQARLIYFSVLRYRLNLGVSDLASTVGRKSSSVVRMMNNAQPVPAQILDDVYARAQVEREIDCKEDARSLAEGW
jgi:hypothetical protein